VLKFDDGEKIETQGELRITSRKDGLYVVGKGMCIPIDSREEGNELIKELNK